MKKRKTRKKKSKAGYRLDGKRVYKVKGKTSSNRKTFKTKKSALAAIKKKRKR